MAVFVLVHGAFHGAWCYAEVAALLRAEGHRVHVPTLSGVGERAHLGGAGINLSTHVRDVVSIILSEDLTDVILCGHSYAGMVITGVAGQVGERIGTLFYLDACVPEDGQSILDCGDRERALKILELAGETGLAVAPLSAEHFGASGEAAERIDRLATPHPIGCFLEKLRYTGKEALVADRSFVLAQRYRSANQAAFERIRDLPGWRAMSLDCGHEVMIEQPNALAALLLAEADRQRSPSAGAGTPFQNSSEDPL